MTLASEIIHRAYREQNLYPLVSTASANQTTEALAQLNAVIDNLFAHEVGTELQDWPVGGTPPTGLWNAWDATVWVNPPPNARLIVSITSATTIDLPKTPGNGARVQVLDHSAGMSLTLDGNGALVDGSATVMATEGTWVYWSHTGEWTKLATLLSGDQLPFPATYDNFFTAALAARLCARHGIEPSSQVASLVERGLEQFRYDYRQASPYDDGRVGSLLTEALKLSGLVPATGTPRQAQVIEALRRLNESLDILLGNEAGSELAEMNIGGSYDETPTNWLPANVRIILNLASAKTLKLSPQPHDGQRLALVDAGGNLATYNLTLDGNGRTIESSSTLALSTNGTARQWFYRADTGNWVRISDVALDSDPPLPREYDDLLIAMTAMRLNPSASAGILQAVPVERTRSKLRSRYRMPRPAQELGTLGLLGSRERAYGESSASFRAGRPRFF